MVVLILSTLVLTFSQRLSTAEERDGTSDLRVRRDFTDWVNSELVGCVCMCVCMCEHTYPKPNYICHLSVAIETL